MMEKTGFGKMPDGTAIQLFTLRNIAGMEIKITNYGGTIVSWTAPDKNGHFEDIVLGYDSLQSYQAGSPYFGAIIGRYGNRIAKGKFSLDNHEYTLAVNNPPNSLHGGIKGFDKAVWSAETPTDSTLNLSYTAKDGEEGYPGNLKVTVIYTLKYNNILHIEYTATTDKPTVINLTNHTYFNLNGLKTDILGHEMQLFADTFLPVDVGLIPTSELRPVSGTAFDFSKPRPIQAAINDTSDIQIKYGKGYDHCWVLSDASQTLHKAAQVYEPSSGRVMDVLTTEPGVQFYAGNQLNGSNIGKKGIVYKKNYGFCLETQHFPDSPNQPKFPNTVLRPGQVYHSITEYHFSVK